MVQKLELDALLERKPGALSGGQRQRVALARAMIRKPGLFLMDEPLANLDAKLRTEMRREIITLQRELGVTTIYVTHDQTEAMTMGTRIAVINGGVLQQFGTPQEIYRTRYYDGNRRGFLRPGRAGGIYSAKAGKDTSI